MAKNYHTLNFIYLNYQEHLEISVNFSKTLGKS